MAGYVNKAIIIGNLGQEPEIKTFEDGNKVCNLSIATTEKWKDKQGEKVEKTEWHRVVVRQGGTSKIIDAFIEPFVKKGNKVYIEGKIQTRQWEQEGSKRYSTEIIVAGPNSVFELLERPPKKDDYKSSNGDYPQDPPFESSKQESIPNW